MAVAVVVDGASERHYYANAATTVTGDGAVVVARPDGDEVARWEPGEWWAVADHDVDPRVEEAAALAPADAPTD